MSCSTTDNDHVMTRRRRFAPKGICVKCKTNRGRIIIRHAAYCKECFEPVLMAKFRGILDPTINCSEQGLSVRGSLQAPGNLLIGFSGGVGSTVLVDLVKCCYLAPVIPGGPKGGKKHPRKTGRPWNKIFICYIDCSACYDVDDRTDEVKTAFENFDENVFEFVPLHLEACFENGQVIVDLTNEGLPLTSGLASSSDPQTSLKNYLGSLPTPSSRESSINTLIRLLLLRTARSRDCSHVLMGTTLTGLSVNLITSVASGSGFTVGLEKGEDWKSHDSQIIRLVLPLREISMKECAAYLHWRNLSVIPNRRILLSPSLSRENVKESIGSLTKGFIYGLERDYPSTVNAIVRTCNKLVSNSTGHGPMQGGIEKWKEHISVRRLEPDGGEDVGRSDLSYLAPHICYACNTTFTSLSSRSTRKTGANGANTQPILMPLWVASNLKIQQQQPMSQSKMEEQIRDFLLE
ncbi:hypothetical protein Clacol_002525 [Clathrus columnatus]|uniref:Cytoplasmic tRNA 2-thiolation protein 2 n=1 Tax=Clathrus columnatus TaxID=1419009 RepID=A0AAV5A505_9AGAM|nr:hypothetical protein Clacol_002525 [Clathrus columnatus]